MTSKREVLVWLGAAVVSTGLLTFALVKQRTLANVHSSIFMAGDPQAGSRLFFEKKGCAHCHSVNGVGAGSAPDLGFVRSPEGSLSQVVSAMWNHAPRMWEQMRSQNIRFPGLDNREMTDLFAFLYTTRYLDEKGDPAAGQRLFQKKGCSGCHAGPGQAIATAGPNLFAADSVDTPILWMQAMWNHAVTMANQVQNVHVKLPRFEAREMNDLLAFIRANCCGERHESELLPANPDRGRQLFESKACGTCHAIDGKGGHQGPALGPGHPQMMTMVQFSALLWNHSPEVSQTQKNGDTRTIFVGQDMADLVAYLASLGYFDPAGSADNGRVVFNERGCSYCHGNAAQGTRSAPAIRRGGPPMTSIMLATALWEHGPSMYRRTQELGRPWPTLEESDVDDVVAFLNSRGTK